MRERTFALAAAVSLGPVMAMAGDGAMTEDTLLGATFYISTASVVSAYYAVQ